MLGSLAKLLLVATSIAPISLTWAFADWRQAGFELRQVGAIAVALLLVVLCRRVLSAARRQLPRISFSAASIRATDSEVVGFMVAYLIPLISTTTAEVDYAVLAFVAAMLSYVIWASDSYSFNPLLTMFGYHFFEVTTTDGVTYMMVTRRRLRRTDDIRSIGELTMSLTIDMTDED